MSRGRNIVLLFFFSFYLITSVQLFAFDHSFVEIKKTVKTNDIYEKNASFSFEYQLLNQHQSPIPEKKVFVELESFNETRIDSFITDSLGKFQFFIFPKKPGLYRYYLYTVVNEEIVTQREQFKLKSKFWPFDIFIGLIGGLGIFLFGINLMSKGLQRAAGEQMRNILSSLTKNRFVAIGVGVFVTMVIQSSSATSVMLISFVQAGLMKFAQSVAIMLGADIGTTITAQLIAFKLSDYALLVVGIGFFIQFFSKKEKYKNLSAAILGFGLLFYGMKVMSDAMYPIRTYEPFINALIKLENPFLGIIAGALFTALIQSSSAFVGIMIILGGQGIISLDAAIPLIFGANIGTSITAFLASLNTDREAKKVALAHIISKTVGVLLFVWWIPLFSNLVVQLSPGDPENLSNVQYIPRQIANAHTIFNVGYVIVFVPFVNSFARLIDKIVPPDVLKKPYELRLKFLDQSFIETPVLALNLAKQETVRMGHKVQSLVSDIMVCFIQKDNLILREIPNKENEINYLRDNIKSYLLKISASNVNQERANESFQIMSTMHELEQIGDVISKILYVKADTWIKSDIKFSKAGTKELIEYHSKTQKQLSRAIQVFEELNLERAKSMKKKQKKYESLALEFSRQHYERLQESKEKSIKSSSYHLEIVNALSLINRYSTNIAKSLLLST